MIGAGVEGNRQRAVAQCTVTIYNVMCAQVPNVGVTGFRWYNAPGGHQHDDLHDRRRFCRKFGKNDWIYAADP